MWLNEFHIWWYRLFIHALKTKMMVHAFFVSHTFSILYDTFTHRATMYRQTEIEVPNESHSMVCNSWQDIAF